MDGPEAHSVGVNPSSPTSIPTCIMNTIKSTDDLPGPPPPKSTPWTWRCVCNTRNIISKARCLSCGRPICTHEETEAESRVRAARFRAVKQQRNKLMDTPIDERKGPSMAVLDGRARRLRKKALCQQDFDYQRWGAWLSWRIECQAHQEMAPAEDEETLSASEREQKSRERKREFGRLRMTKKKERRERLAHAEGDCEMDCRWPGECYQVLRRVLAEEEKEEKKQETEESCKDEGSDTTSSATPSDTTPVPQQPTQPVESMENWYARRLRDKERENAEEGEDKKEALDALTQLNASFLDNKS